uniref:Uncharacterized protein n=1 Tax=Chromera velia CCMP2878 TaxID=1169474 RepID=A0A0G4HLB3_9ALVE|eukprot:Cvel_28731.t1-p1 / transcript=Cvel_28731.t1 / gene=Cvel_28731 / organism=Chromera_velia_CCMP2878 / gene_product=hypothetical protein / transcript_product=hypothetical protein / location=Cvel_scaffold3817:1742-3012(+) / protein_length=217 / sequence_SO=supercontig / SO=protein_coding / is_pseudo=false
MAVLRLVALTLLASGVPLARAAFDKDLLADLKLADLFKADVFDLSKLGGGNKEASKGKKAKKCSCEKDAALVCESLREVISEGSGCLKGQDPRPCGLETNITSFRAGNELDRFDFAAIFNLTGCDGLMDDLTTADFSATITLGEEFAPSVGIEITDEKQIIVSPSPCFVEGLTFPANPDAYPLDLVATLEFDTEDCDVLTATAKLTITDIDPPSLSV